MNERLAQVKNHFYENKEVYIALAVGIVLGAVVKALSDSDTQIVNVNNNNNNLYTSSYDENFGGYSQKIVRKNSTGDTWLSSKSAAESAGVSPQTMSNHTNGNTDHIYGETYTVIGLCTSNGIY